MSERVHPVAPPPETPESPETPLTSGRKPSPETPKPSPPPGHYYIQVPKDQIYRLPPPENAALFASYTKRGKRRSGAGRCRRLLCCLAAALAVAALLAAAAAAALYFTLRPKTPKYSISALSGQGFNLSGDRPLSPAITADFRAENPNSKIGVSYRDGSDISVYYNGVGLCSGAWPVFYQPKNNVTVFRVRLVGSGVVLGNERAPLVEAEKSGAVPVRVDFRVPVRVKVGSVMMWTWTVRVGCDVSVSGLEGEARVLSQECKVRVRWL